MVKAGTAYIDIEGDFTPLERQVARKTAKSAGTAHVDVDANTQPLDRKIDVTRGKLEELGRNSMSGLGDGFAKAARGADVYERSATQAAKATDLWQDSQGKWRNSTGRFASAAEKATAGVDRLGDSFDGLHKKKTKTDDLIKKNVGTFGQFGNAISSVDGLLGQFGGGFGKLSTTILAAAPPLIAFGGAATALVSALGPLVGLGPAAAVGLSAMGQAAGVFALASIGVGDALKEQLQATGKAAQAAVTGADQQRAAARAIAQAQEGVRNATERVASASESLTAAEHARADALRALGPAQSAARRALVDMHVALTNAALSEQGAVLRLKDARTALSHAQSPQDAQALLDAQQRLTGSVLDQQAAVRGLVAARERLEELTRPPDALTLADAEDAIADATRGQERAALDLVDAREKLAQLESPAAGDERGSDEDIARAKLAVADAENAIGDASRQSARAQASLVKLQNGPDQKEIADAKQDIADAERNVADAATETAKSEKAVQDAQRGADPEEIARAKYDVAAAEQALADATRDRARLQKDATAADRAGVDGSAQVIAAKQQIADADEQLAAAQKSYRDSMRDVARAEQAAADARTDARAGMAATALAAADLNEKMNGLPPAAQAFVRQLVSLKPRLDEIRGVAAAGLFPGVTEGIQSAMKNFEPLKRVIGSTAEVLGGLAARAGELVGSKGFGKDLETIGDRNTLIIDRLGRGAIYLSDAFRHLLVAAGPLTTWLAKVALGWAKSADGAAEAGRESGKLAGFFQSTRNTLIKVASIVGNLAEAFFNVGKAAAPSGRDILDAIDKITAKFAGWTKSLQGTNALKNFFEQSNAVMAAIVPIIADVAKNLGGLVFHVLPAYAAILEKIGPLATPLIATVLAFKGLATIASGLAGLVKIAQSFQLVWVALGAAAAPVAIIAAAVAGLGIAFVIAYSKSEKFREIVQGVFAKIKTAVPEALKTVRKWLGLGNQDTDNLKTSLHNLGAAAQWVFENILKPAAEKVFPILIGYLHGYIEALGGFIKIVTGIFSGDWSRVWDGAKQVVEGTFRVIWSVLSGAVGLLWDAAKALGNALVEGLIAGLTALSNALLAPFEAAWNAILKFFGVQSPSKLFMDLGGYLVAGLVAGLKAGLRVLLDAAKWLADTLVGGVKAYLTAYKDAGKWVLEKLTDGFKAVTSVVTGAAKWLLDTLKTGLEALASFFVNRGKDVIGWIGDGLQTAAAKVTGFAGWLVGTLKDGLTAAAAFFVNRGKDVIGWIGDGIQVVADSITKFPKWLVDTLKDLLKGDKIVEGFKGLGGSIMGWIIDGLKAGAFELQGFLNKIIGLINRVIPGHEGDIKPINVLTKDPNTGEIKGLARGGAFARTGGYVNQPMTFMGEEAPRHPEFVIPTNPAYRDRAQLLLAQAAATIGLKRGGMYSQQQIADLWKEQGGNKSKAADMSWVAMAESHGDAGINYGGGHFSPLGQAGKLASGLYQILGLPFPGDVYDAAINTRMAIAKSNDGQNLHPWDASRPVWGPHIGSGGILSKIGGAIGNVVNALNPFDLISKLPDVGGLGWLKNAGKYVLGKVTEYIKDKLGGLLPGGGGGATSGPDGIGAFRGVPMANWVIESLKHAEKKLGTDLHPTSGWRSQAQQDAIRARDPRAATISEHLGTQYPKGAVDFGGFTDAHAKVIKDAVVAATADFKWPLLPPSGFDDDGHASGTGHKKGGVFSQLPFAGAFATGGIVPGPIGAPAAAIVHGGERITAPGAVASVRVFIGDRELTDIVRVEIDEHDRETSNAYAAGVA